MCYLANGEDPDEMSHNAAFHQVLHCLLRQKQYSEKKNNNLEIIIKDSSQIHSKNPLVHKGF